MLLVYIYRSVAIRRCSCVLLLVSHWLVQVLRVFLSFGPSFLVKELIPWFLFQIFEELYELHKHSFHGFDAMSTATWFFYAYRKLYFSKFLFVTCHFSICCISFCYQKSIIYLDVYYCLRNKWNRSFFSKSFVVDCDFKMTIFNLYLYMIMKMINNFGLLRWAWLITLVYQDEYSYLFKTKFFISNCRRGVQIINKNFVSVSTNTLNCLWNN